MKMLRIKIAKRGRLRYNISRSRQEGYGLNQLGTFIQVMTEKEAVKEGMEISGGIRFCKVEKIQGSYVGSLYIPSRAKNRSHTGFYFRIEKDKIIFVDDSGKVLEWLKEMLKAGDEKQPELGIFFADFLEYLIKDDVIFITKLEHSLEELEDMVLEKGSDIPFNHEISGYRRKVSLFSHYYLQLADVSSILYEDDNHIFKEKEKRSFSLFTERVNRLHDETLMLRDYCVQIREVYQSLIDERQNEIMKLLTIVTTIVLPLSLVAGWYGMNFTNMPELTWHYGYGFIILLSIVITILNILYFKKKKFW